MTSVQELAALYSKAHDRLRAIDGLQPTEAFDELMKYLLVRELQAGAEGSAAPGSLDDLDVSLVAGPKELRQWLGTSPSTRNGSMNMWDEREFRLSDDALGGVHSLLSRVAFTRLDFDARSAALRTFLTPELRRGLGIFLTPDHVARAIVELVDPPAGSSIYDPACGSGTFLVEVVRHWRALGAVRDQAVAGSDVNSRMLRLADLNLGHDQSVRLILELRDAFKIDLSQPRSWPTEGSVDFIFTNPPFGVALDPSFTSLEGYETCKRSDGRTPARLPSEVVFAEICLRMLKPDGILGIVLPKSVVTNASLKFARTVLAGFGTVEEVVALPSETFATTGTLTTTYVLIVRRRSTAKPKGTQVRLARVKNVGFDSTGRPRKESDLGELVNPASPIWETLAEVPGDETFTKLKDLIGGWSPSAQASGLTIADIAEPVATGKTPARSAYSDGGLFLVKVGNLTGRGVDWTPRARNFVRGREADHRLDHPVLALRPGDILMTSSAHAQRYIAAKIDIVDDIPSAYGARASFVGEVLMLRPRIELVDPYVLLAYLRIPRVSEALRQLARGQTAHLNPGDVGMFPVDERLLDPPQSLLEAADAYREQGSAWRAFTRACDVAGDSLARADSDLRT